MADSSTAEGLKWGAGTPDPMIQAVKDDLCDLYVATGQPESRPAYCPRVAFVTSTTYGGGALGGLAGADTECQTHAESAGLASAGSPVFKAWLSDSSTNARDRFTSPGGPWVTTGPGNPVADDLTDLTTCDPECLDNPISLTETGGVPARTNTHTGTNAAGNKFSGNCGDWANQMADGLFGHNNSTASGWVVSNQRNCGTSGDAVLSHVYCFEQ